MKKYSVQVMEIRTHWVDVDADNIDEAKEAAERLVDENNLAGWDYSIEAHDVLEVKQ